MLSSSMTEQGDGRARNGKSGGGVGSMGDMD